MYCCSFRWRLLGKRINSLPVRLTFPEPVLSHIRVDLVVHCSIHKGTSRGYVNREGQLLECAHMQILADSKMLLTNLWRAGTLYMDR